MPGGKEAGTDVISAARPTDRAGSGSPRGRGRPHGCRSWSCARRHARAASGWCECRTQRQADAWYWRVAGNTHCQDHSRLAFGYFKPSPLARPAPQHSAAIAHSANTAIDPPVTPQAPPASAIFQRRPTPLQPSPSNPVPMRKCITPTPNARNADQEFSQWKSGSFCRTILSSADYQRRVE